MSGRLRDRAAAGAVLKLTVFVVVTAVVTAGLALTIANVGLGESNRFSAVFTDVTGVEKGDDVRISGVRVGEVREIDVLQRDDRTLARLTFTVDADQQLARTTNAAVRYRNLVGQRYIALTEGAGAGGSLPAGATIPLARTEEALDLQVLFNGFEPLFSALSPKDVNQLSTQIIQVLQGEAGTVEGLLTRTASLTSELADRERVIDDLIENLDSVLVTLSERDERLDDLLVELNRFVSGLSEDREAIGESLESIVDLQDSTTGLLAEARPGLEKDVAELRALAGNLDDNSELVERTLQRMPEKVTDLTRTATYGSWWNFYMCDAEARVVLPDGTELPRTGLHMEAARCQR